MTRVIPALIDRIYTLFLRLVVGHIGRGAVIEFPVKWNHPEKVWIGSGARVAAGTWLNCSSSPDDEFTLRIGADTYVGRNCHINAWKSVTIGSEVLVANNVYISDATHEFRDRRVSIKRQGERFSGPVEIKRGAWIGHCAAILPNTSVGINSVIGALSLVRRPIPDYCVAAGVPATVIREVAPTEEA